MIRIDVYGSPRMLFGSTACLFSRIPLPRVLPFCHLCTNLCTMNAHYKIFAAILVDFITQYISIFCFFKKQTAFNVRMLKSRHDALFYSVHRPIQSLFGHFMLLFSHKAKRLNHCCKVNKKSRHPNKYSPIMPFNYSCRALEKAKNKLIGAIKG